MHWSYGGLATGLSSILFTVRAKSLWPCKCHIFILHAAALTLFLSYLGMYGVIVSTVILFSTWGFIVYTFSSLRASRVVHYKLISSLLGSTFRSVRQMCDVADRLTTL